ncbi:MAG: ferritin-like domain-containing protein [Deltaproteobacteria bacterium]|nr:ferritin-like domain-containing protein [Deltaproteobacteria bacterium]
MATAPASLDRSDQELESILTSFDTSYVWNYGSVKEGLRDLYEKAKREQWNGSELLDWSTEVDPESEIIPQQFNPLEDYGPYKKLSPKQVREFRHAQLAWTLSQFLHGEQGAMITASQLVGAVPWTDGKYYASSQTMDEARHTEVFARYLNEKLEWEWPINPNLKSLLDIVLTDSRWDLKFLGMQIVVEGLAMAAFANMYMMAQEPLLKELLKNVMRDESRHVAFGVLSLRGYYDDMPANELKDREEFLMEACTLMRDRLVGEDVSEHFGFDKEEVRKIVLESPVMQEFRRLIFMRVVPNVKRLGLVTPRVRKHFEDLRIIEFEDVDPEAMDRQLGIA